MIEGLHDIVLPEAVSYLPQTVGWLFVVVVLSVLILWAVYRRYRHRQANRYRSLALTRLTEIEDQLATSAERTNALVAIPKLVKQVALEAYPREDVASLSDGSWLEFLDESYGGSGFREGPGRLLPVLSYVSPTTFPGIRREEVNGLTALVKRWIKKHRSSV